MEYFATIRSFHCPFLSRKIHDLALTVSLIVVRVRFWLRRVSRLFTIRAGFVSAPVWTFLRAEGFFLKFAHNRQNASDGLSPSR